MGSFEITRRNGEVYTVLVDDEDLRSILSAGQVLTVDPKPHTTYVYARSPGARAQYLHRVLLGATKGCQVDHVNGNGLDNRRENLRLCTQTLNNGNQRLAKHNTSGIKGVAFHKASKKFRAYISVGDRHKHLGLFLTEAEARQAYRDAALAYFGEFARFE